MFNSKTNYEGGRFGKLADPEVTSGVGKRTVTINRSAEFGKNGLLYWMQNFSFKGEDFGAGVGGPQGTFPSACESFSIWFHMSPVRRAGNVGCGSIAVDASREAEPIVKC